LVQSGDGAGRRQLAHRALARIFLSWRRRIRFPRCAPPPRIRVIRLVLHLIAARASGRTGSLDGVFRRCGWLLLRAPPSLVGLGTRLTMNTDSMAAAPVIMSSAVTWAARLPLITRSHGRLRARDRRLPQSGFMIAPVGGLDGLSVETTEFRRRPRTRPTSLLKQTAPFSPGRPDLP